MTGVVEPRGRSGRAWIVRMVLAALLALLALGWLWAARAGHPSDGTSINTDSRTWRADGVVLTVAVGADTPLRAGDTVVAIDGRPLASGSLADPRPVIGDTVVYTVDRAGVRLDVPVTLTDYPFPALAERNAHTLPYILFMVLLPALVVARRPRDPAAVTLYLVAVLQFIGYASHMYGTQAIEVATGRLWVSTAAEVVNCLLWACLLHFAISFPQTWPVLRRRPWLTALAYVLPFAAYAMVVAHALPTAHGLRRTWTLLGVSVPAAEFFPLLVLAAVIVSYVLARDPAARQRMRLVSYGLVVLAGGYLLLGRLPEQIIGRPLIPWEYLTIVWLPALLLLAAAVLRHRLWDIQLILRRSLVYGLVTITLIGVYLGIAALLSEAFDTRLGFAPVLLAVMVALSFSAARTALRRAVSRLVYGEREDPYEVLRQIGQRLESAHSAETALHQLVSTLVRALRLTHAAIEVPGLALPSSSHGVAGPTATRLVLSHDGEPIGQLVLDPGPDREPFGPSDRRLLGGLARQVSTTAHGLLLAARLQRTLEGTVTVLEEERRRLRREIHDGLGPTLASASMRLELGRSLIRSDPAAAERILADLAQVHRAVVGDIRQLVDGLRPTVLDHLGLSAALRELVDRLGGGLRTHLDCSVGADPIAAAVEVAAYRIVSEALTNVVRHASAETCAIRVWRDGDLHIEVTDDGRGLAPDYRPGMGLTSIRERCLELGGKVAITAASPRGTVVRCRLPISVTAASGGELIGTYP
ncbi:signal transduction histidine kinase [Allocatelliglobosispora scoriae]|uniref:histidine kinase n=1 Tax=Allocatelliglobosispora scoriae TaxID=643052 RepID=A0A841C672_9ACTN|nr:ATP-binding protein [Allocatelliglobosispora scoriae]MBB5874291.1 signal transduction histidine kinase [Allocatelliglobosispora scoriae]